MNTPVKKTRPARKADIKRARRPRKRLARSLDGVALLDPETMQVLDANEALAATLGRPVNKVIGHFPWEWDANLSRQDLLQLADLIRPGKAGREFETAIRRHDGTLLDVRATLSTFGKDNSRRLVMSCRNIAQRKENEKALQRQTELYRCALANSSDGVMLMSFGGAVLEANVVLAEMLGYTPDELVGMHPRDWDVRLADEQQVPELVAYWTAETSTVKNYQTQLRRKDGSLVHVDMRLVRLDIDGASYTYGTVRDISSSRNAEQALRESEARFRSLFETTRRLVGVLSPDGRNLASNPVGYAFTGLSPEEAARPYLWEGHWWLDDLDRGRVRDACARAARGEYVQFEIGQRSVDGQVYMYDFSIAPICDESGDVTLLMAEANDVTELKRSEAELKSRQDFLHAIFGQMPGGLALVDEQTHAIVEFNDCACTMHGYTREEFAGLRATDLKQAVTQPQIEQRLKKLVKNGGVRFEDVHLRKDGSQFDVQVSLGRLNVEDRQLSLALWTDISELKQLQRCLQAKEEEVRTLVENTPVGIARYDTQLRGTYVSAAMRQFAGADIEELVGRKPDDPRGFLKPEKYLAALKKTLSTGRGRQIQMEFVTADRKKHWALIAIQPERNKEGETASILVTARDVTELVTQRNRLQELAYVDTLTGLANRAAFIQRLAGMIGRRLRDGRRAALLLLDFDRFKDVNDSLGHAAGDELLRQICGRIQGCLRKTDLLARLGGDEFALLLNDLGKKRLIGPVVDRLREVFETPFQIAGSEIFISTSIGIAICPDDGQTTDEILANADAAMYSAKQQGPACAQYYSSKLTEAAAQRLTLSTALQTACIKNQFEVLFQPKLLLSTEGCIGAEALLRWHHPELGLLMPDAFIPLAEETGKIVEIGRYVLFQACRAAVEWNHAADASLRVAVNLSSRQFTYNDVVSDIRKALRETGCEGKWLECEITEGLILDNSEAVQEALAELRGMGVTIAIDDFGTGYAALSYLHQFDFNTLKIDRSFVDGIERDHRKVELVRAFLSIADALQMDVVAEGIENAEQAQGLKSIGCGVGQGCYYGSPMRREEFQQYLENFH